ncbi:MurT ligase domain-containing protein [Collinsella tanakaei]|uniref:MurT ligase domain-containing protein n=1 Tax=Collinsella tanakaei TaxID=626935 RepID=UPI003159D60D
MSTAASGRRGPRFHLAMAVSKAAASGLKLLHRNAGQMPGVIAEAIDPAFISHIGKPEHIVFVSGTNGKTTTNNLLNDLLADNNVGLIDNRAGGNILTGVESTFIKNADLSGRQRVNTAVMELDELSFRRVLPYVTPEIILVTNLYRDSFSRNANPDFIFSVMSEHISPETKLILNADDLISCRLAPQNASRVYFSLGPLAEDTPDPQGIACDLTACPECGGKLEYDYCHLRHLGHAHCTSCGFTNPEPSYLVTAVDREAHTFTVRECAAPGAPSYTYRFGVYSITNLYNLFAATVVARELGLSPEAIAASLERGINVTAARYAEQEVGGKRLVALASKGENSTATSVALDTIRREPGDKIVVLMLADAHKAESPVNTEYIGWYYQSDFEYLTDPAIKQVVVQGVTSEDLLLRLRLAGVDPAKLNMVKTPEEAADAIDLTRADSVFWAYDIFNGADVEKSRERLIARIETGEGTKKGASIGAVAATAPVAAAASASGSPVIEVLFPEYGNQAGDNGNVMYLRACLPNATFVETSHGDVPYFADARPDLIVMCGMTERQQETVIERLRPYRDRLAQLVDEGVHMLFTGNAPEVLARAIEDARGTRIEGLGLIDAVVKRDTSARYLSVQVGSFEPAPGAAPLEVVGFKIQFTQVEGDNGDSFFIEDSVGWGLNEQSKLEGFRLNNLIATWIIGPLLPLNPDFTAWLIGRISCSDEVQLAFEPEARAAYVKRAAELKTPGMHLAY